MNLICRDLREVSVTPDAIILRGNTELTIKGSEVYDYTLLAGAIYLEVFPPAYQQYKKWHQSQWSTT